MNYEDEPFVKIYTRDTAEWLDLPWQARGLMTEIVRKVDRSGILKVGKLGLRGVALIVRAPFEEIEASLRQLIDGERLLYREARGELIVPNHVDAQGATQTDAARKRRSRESARAAAIGDADLGENRSRAVTRGHEESRAVTLDSLRSDQKSLDPLPAPAESGLVAAQVPERKAPDLTAAQFHAVMYADAQREVSGKPFTIPRGTKDLLALAELAEHARAEGVPTLEAVGRWIEQASRDYRRTLGGDGKHQCGFAPFKCLEWVQAGRHAATSVASLRTVPDTPPAPYHRVSRGYRAPPDLVDMGAAAGALLAKIGGGGK